LLLGDSVYYIFYTGVTDLPGVYNSYQRIGVATSTRPDDLEPIRPSDLLVHPGAVDLLRFDERALGYCSTI